MQALAVHHVGSFPARAPRHFVPFNLERYRLQRAYPPHRHTYAELTVVMSGTGLHAVEGRCYPVSAGEVFVIHPGVVHWFEALQDFQHVNVYFEFERFAPAKHLYEDLPVARQLLECRPGMTSSFGSRARLPAAALPSIARQIDRIERELHGDRNGRELMVRASFHELLVAIARSGEQHGSGRGGPDRVARVVDHIQQHYSEALELSELAALAGVSSSQLLRLFREELNTTPMACVTDLRLERARELLAAPGPPVTEIALSLGYCDGPHFANAFKRRFGTSPTSYRRGCLAVERATDGGSEMPQRR